MTFTYTATGKRASMTDGTGTTSYAYDSLDRLTVKATPQGTLTYTYDAAGNVASMTSSNANGTTVAYTYDSLNRLSTVVDGRLPLGKNTTTYSYDNASNLVTATYPNGLQSTQSYDQLNRLTSLTSPVSSYNYQFSPTGNRTSATEQTGRTLNWSYDGIYRLTNESIAQDPAEVDGSVSYSLDPVGNRLSETSSLHGLNSGLFNYNADDWQSTETYDANGNVLTTGGKSFGYDSENQLVSMNGGTVGLQYDGDGNRVSETVNGTTTRYLVDDLNPTGYAQVVEELVNGSVQRQYSYGLQRIEENQIINNAWTPSFYGYDGGGNVRQLTNLAGVVTDTYSYDAFGNLLVSTGTTPNNYLYRGEQYDPHLSLYYLRARFYNTTTGRFTGRDPEDGGPADPSSLDAYLFASSDPVNRIDPSGRSDLVETTTINGRDLLASAALTFLAVKLACEFDTESAVLTAITKPGVLGHPQTVDIWGSTCRAVSKGSGSKPAPKPAPDPEPAPAPAPAPGPSPTRDKGYVVRLQAQGNKVEESVVLADTEPITVAAGLAGLEALKGMLTKRQLKQRSVPFMQAERWISSRPPVGAGPPGKSFAYQETKIRVDVEILLGVNFVQ